MTDHNDSRNAFAGGWNYRVVERGEGATATFAICEVYYDDDGKIENWTDPVSVQGEGCKAALRAELKSMGLALTRPTLQYDELPSSGDAR